MDAQYVRCNKCRRTLAEARSWQRCETGHVLCNSCSPHLFLMELSNCSICQKKLMSEEEYARTIPSIESQVMRRAWKFQFWWWKYLFRNPDLVLVILAWGFSLIFLISAGRNKSFFANVMEWIVGSIFVAAAPVLTLMFIRKKKSGLGMIAGWMAAWRGDRRPVWIIIGIASIIFLIHLIMEPYSIG